MTATARMGRCWIGRLPRPKGALATIAQCGGGPIAAGTIASLTGSFSGAFLTIDVVLLIGIFAYIVVLGGITPLPDRDPSSAHEIAGAH